MFVSFVSFEASRLTKGLHYLIARQSLVVDLRLGRLHLRGCEAEAMTLHLEEALGC